ncbi:MAG: hypothetical protein AAF489_03665 [Bacteroidota bacterium]
MTTKFLYSFIPILWIASIATAQQEKSTFQANALEKTTAAPEIPALPFDNNDPKQKAEDAQSKRKIEENRILSEKARAKRAQITEAVRKRLAKRIDTKTTNDELQRAYLPQQKVVRTAEQKSKQN